MLVGCGGGGKKEVAEPSDDDDLAMQKPKPQPEDPETVRRRLIHSIVPEGSSCLPASLKEEGAPRLELAAVGKDAVVCAIDEQPDRLLGPVGCWKVDLASGKLEYKAPEPLPARGFSVMLEGKCARGYCLPSEPSSSIVSFAKNLDGKKVAILAGDDVHIFDAESKAHESSFSVRGDKGVTNDPKAVHFLGERIVVEGADQGPYAAAWVFKIDGAAVGPITMLGAKDNKPISSYKGSFSILDKVRVAIGHHGMATLNTFDVNTGARAKLVRKVDKLACKPAEIDAYFVDGDKVTDKCRASIEKASGHLIGATVVAGAKNFLVLLRGNRLGELAVMDAKSLAEKSVIKMPWCGADSGDDASADAGPKKKSTTRGADPQEGGE